MIPPNTLNSLGRASVAPISSGGTPGGTVGDPGAAPSPPAGASAACRVDPASGPVSVAVIRAYPCGWSPASEPASSVAESPDVEPSDVEPSDVEPSDEEPSDEEPSD